MKNSILAFIAGTLLFAAIGCQSPLRKFDKIKKGMEKHDVLETLGSPDASFRWKGQDRWVYRLYDKANAEVREVHFVAGKVSYTGVPIQPEVSAAEQDAKNESENAALAAQEQAQQQENRAAYPKYESEVQGTGEGELFVPDFKPVQ